MNKITFARDYHKLNDEKFTTIRGKSHFQKFMIGEEIEIYLNNELLCLAEVTGLELCRLSDIPIETLKKDGEFSGFVIRSSKDFIGLINSMRLYHKIKDDSEEMTVIYLRKLYEMKHRYGPEWDPEPLFPKEENTELEEAFL